MIERIREENGWSSQACDRVKSSKGSIVAIDKVQITLELLTQIRDQYLRIEFTKFFCSNNELNVEIKLAGDG